MLAAIILCAMACSDKESIELATVVTGGAVVDGNTVKCDGQVTADGGSSVFDRGICYSQTTQTPTAEDAFANGGNGRGSFSTILQGLDTGTYYYRSYATNEAGVAYGSTKTFSVKTNVNDDGGGEEPQIDPYEGAILHPFTISSDGHKVYFSKGNLQYNAALDQWRFAEHQYDYAGSSNSMASSAYGGWIDLFGYGTSGWDNGTEYYMPYTWTYSENGYLNHSLIEDYAEADWGVHNAIINGGNQAGIWRTLTGGEWHTLLGGITIRSGKYGLGTVGNNKGLIILPDDWEAPEGISFTRDMENYTTNVYSMSQWSEMETAGAVLLPCAGTRVALEIRSPGIFGTYWSSTVESGTVSGFYFHPYGFQWSNLDRYMGRCVRLVREITENQMNKL